MTTDKDLRQLSKIIERRGVNFVLQSIREENRNGASLTIVSNIGMHPVPREFVCGEIFIASEGNLDFSSIDSVNCELDSLLVKVRNKLFERPWNKIYLIPFGHAVVNMNIKLLVYRVLRIETIDVFHFGEGRYGILERDMRRTLSAVSEPA